MAEVVSLIGSSFDAVVTKHGIVEAVNRFVRQHGYLPSQIVDDEKTRELRDAPDISPEALALL